jgi:Rod binding domain-containing protein
MTAPLRLRELVDLVLRYALLVTEVPVEAVKKTVSAQFGPEGEKALMTAAEKLTEEARQQALAQGLAQGVALGRAETVLKQLSLRFGPLPDAVSCSASTAPRSPSSTR